MRQVKIIDGRNIQCCTVVGLLLVLFLLLQLLLLLLELPVFPLSSLLLRRLHLVLLLLFLSSASALSRTKLPPLHIGNPLRGWSSIHAAAAAVVGEVASVAGRSTSMGICVATRIPGRDMFVRLFT